MSRRLAVLGKVGALLGMLCAIAFSIVMIIKNDQLRRQAKALAKLRDDVCQRLEWDLKALLRRPTDIMPRIVYHHLDQGLTNLCFGTPIVVDTSEADYCWILRGEPECFLDVARALLDAHRQHRRRRTPWAPFPSVTCPNKERKMFKIKVEIQGSSPLLMNRFTEESAAKISAGSSSAITIAAKGTPRSQAEPKLYLTGDGKPMIPGPNIFAALVAAGVFHKAGRKQITTGKSSLIPAGIQVDELECPLVDPYTGKVPQWEVDSRSVVIPSTGGRVMCHRPRFDAWKVEFTLSVDEKMFDEAIVRALVDDMGSKVGLGDFRPARKGPFGRFLVSSWKVERTKLDDKRVKAA